VVHVHFFNYKSTHQPDEPISSCQFALKT